MSFAGCFGGDKKISDEGETSSESLDDWQVHFALSISDLPDCVEETNGRLYYVESQLEFQVCKENGWEIIEIIGPKGADGQDGVNGTDGSSGTNGQDGAQGPQGIQDCGGE